jgi:SAM-dependent methyltransferase
MSLYHNLKKGYSSILPAHVRTFLWQNPITRGPREWLLRRVERLATHEEIYDATYFEKAVDPSSAASAPYIARSLIEACHPRSVVDVGCGTGQILLALAALGVPGRGLEYSDAAIRMCRDRGLEVRKHDIENDNPPADWHADLVVSTEVAEHLPARCADRFVDLLCGIADCIFLTAAVPGNTGTDHVNEQPNQYWIQKLRDRGYVYDETASNSWRQSWKSAGVAEWYCQSAMLFRNAGKASSIDRLS